MSELSSADCVIVGAGPAGLSAAELAAKEGLKTIVLEEHPTIGLPVNCAEGMSLEKLKEFNIPTKVVSVNDKTALVERIINLQRFFFGKQGVAISRLETTLIDRPRFEQYLGTVAENAGAEIWTNTAATHMELSKDHVSIHAKESKGGSIKIVAKVVIGADGPASRVRRWAGLDQGMEIVQGVEYRVKGVHTDALDFYFDHELFPEGYGWVFPKNEVTNIGLVCTPKMEARERLDKFIKQVGQKYSIEKLTVEKVIAGIIPSSGPLAKTYKDRILLVGDAGGFPNPIFYGGIAIAMHTGKLAAQTIIEAEKNGNFGEEELKRYQGYWEEMPYSDPSTVHSHNQFYHELTNHDLDLLGILLDGIDLSKYRTRDKMTYIYRTIRHRSLWSIKKWQKFLELQPGFAVARDWGF